MHERADTLCTGATSASNEITDLPFLVVASESGYNGKWLQKVVLRKEADFSTLSRRLE